ncbi:glycosyltransferase [Photobacterium carnosum]|uniref:glycosyltransferase family 2 protein n=1 Tax=Photobacterium carnosum TaxID=2023717 RepID=UPI001E2B0ABE|nr:glycosyltransferase [Photobacterium carnosum]MCD9547780.1 glycosyltransferase [Photobacterium carnosum]MCF2305619.1 glycosyltransferase [Photobacterium carnosum]
MSKITPLLSVIVPIYQVEKYLEQCLSTLIDNSKSIISGEAEIILINDGSFDNSEAIAQKFADKFVFVSLYNKDNGGLSDARNYGLGKIKSNYISFIDSDDFVVDSFIDEIVFIIKQQTFDILSFDFEKKYGDFCSPIENNNADCQVKNVDKDFYLDCSVFAWQRIYNKKLFKAHKFTKNLYFEDVALIPLLIDESSCLLYFNKSMYAYRQRNGSICSHSNNDYLDILRAIKNLTESSRSQFINYIVAKQVFTLVFISLRKSLKEQNENLDKIGFFLIDDLEINKIDTVLTKYTIFFYLYKIFGVKVKFLFMLLSPLAKFHSYLKSRKIKG